MLSNLCPFYGSFSSEVWQQWPPSFLCLQGQCLSLAYSPACPAVWPAWPPGPLALAPAQPPAVLGPHGHGPCYLGTPSRHPAAGSSHTCVPCSPRQPHCGQKSGSPVNFPQLLPQQFINTYGCQEGGPAGGTSMTLCSTHSTTCPSPKMKEGGNVCLVYSWHISHGLPVLGGLWG
jgi:hypothetical protein